MCVRHVCSRGSVCMDKFFGGLDQRCTNNAWKIRNISPPVVLAKVFKVAENLSDSSALCSYSKLHSICYLAFLCLLSMCTCQLQLLELQNTAERYSECIWSITTRGIRLLLWGRSQAPPSGASPSTDHSLRQTLPSHISAWPIWTQAALLRFENSIHISLMIALLHIRSSRFPAN